MQQVIDSWGTIVGTKGEPVRNLFVRGSSLVWRQQVQGKRLLRAVGVRRLRPGESLSRDLVKQAVDWIRRAEAVAVSDVRGIEALDGVRAKRQDVALGKILEAYEAECALRGAPKAETVRDNVSALRRVVEIGLGVSDGAAVGVRRALSRETIVGYEAEMLRRGEADPMRARRTIRGTITQARCVFGRELLGRGAYDRFDLPDLSQFMKFPLESGFEDRAPFSAEEVRIIRSGAGLRETSPGMYAAWFLGYYLALRQGEMVQVRGDWLRRYELTDLELEGAGWLKEMSNDQEPMTNGRRWVWVLDLRGGEVKNEASGGIVPVADDVAEEFRRICGDQAGYFLPGETATGRKDVVDVELSGWFKAQGWSRPHKAHELRAYRMQVWQARYGLEVAGAWARHTIKGVARHYVTRVCFSRRPLGLGE